MGEFLQNDTGKNLSVAWGNPAIPIRNAADLKANAPDAGPGRPESAATVLRRELFRAARNPPERDRDDVAPTLQGGLD